MTVERDETELAVLCAHRKFIRAFFEVNDAMQTFCRVRGIHCPDYYTYEMDEYVNGLLFKTQQDRDQWTMVLEACLDGGPIEPTAQA
jgi:hypothetical protein